jgi:hypothetical protein
MEWNGRDWNGIEPNRMVVPGLHGRFADTFWKNDMLTQQVPYVTASY